MKGVMNEMNGQIIDDVNIYYLPCKQPERDIIVSTHAGVGGKGVVLYQGHCLLINGSLLGNISILRFRKLIFNFRKLILFY